MTARKTKTAEPTAGEELGLKLLQSAREMKARNFARATEAEVNEVVQARQSTGLSQSEFASALSISKRTLQEWEQGRRVPSEAAQALIRIARNIPRWCAKRSPERSGGSGRLESASRNHLVQATQQAASCNHCEMPISRRHLLLASAMPSLASCAGGISQLRERPVTALAKDLSVYSAAYAVLRGARPGGPVLVSGCAESGEQTEPTFQAASLTKPVIAFAALQLALDGQLNLKAPVSHYLPAGYKHYHSTLARWPDDPHHIVSAVVLARISIAALLNHTSGLPNWSSGLLSFEFEPDKRWGYSGEGFVLLQSVIEAVTGMELSAYFDEHVFARLGMPDTSLVWRDGFATRLVSRRSASGRTRQLRFLKPVAATSLYTTATDYAKFMSAALTNDQIVSLVLSGLVQVDSALGLQWGLGWGIENSAGGPCVWQWGNIPGYPAFAIASVASKDGFVMLTNSERGMPHLRHRLRTRSCRPRTTRSGSQGSHSRPYWPYAVNFYQPDPGGVPSSPTHLERCRHNTPSSR